MLVGTGPDAYMKGMRMLVLLILAALVMATILAGCGGAGSWGSSQAPEEQQASRTTGSMEQKAEGARASGQALRGLLGHPALGDADAPVVLTEYSDYQ
jgi:protein-disulfide isomerase